MAAGAPIELSCTVAREQAEQCLKYLNWFFDQNPNCNLIQQQRTTYNSKREPKTTTRYFIKEREPEKTEAAAGQEEESGSRTEGESNHE